MRRRIRRYLRREGVAGALAEELASEAEAQFQWIDRRRLSGPDRRRAADVLDGAAEGFARMEGALDERLKKVVLRAIQGDAPVSEIRGRIERALSVGRHQARTVANTAQQGFSRATFFRSAQQIRDDAPDDEDETLYFKYVGPPPERTFCKKHLGRVYTESEIKRLGNGQGLPVRCYCGGYRCRHRWILAGNKEAARRMENPELRPRDV